MTTGFFEGLLRAAQSSIIGYIIFIIVLVVASILIDKMIAMADVEDQVAVRKFKKWAVSLIFLIGTVIFVVSTLTTATVNRLPRNDADKSGVYSQMDSNLTPSQPAKQ